MDLEAPEWVSLGQKRYGADCAAQRYAGRPALVPAEEPAESAASVPLDHGASEWVRPRQKRLWQGLRNSAIRPSGGGGGFRRANRERLRAPLDHDAPEWL